MYLEKIIIKNISAIEYLEFTASFTEEGNPKPIIIVGANGSGKTTLLSNIIDSFYEISSNLFSNVAKMENTSRKFYKINGVPNLSFGENKGFVLIKYKSKNIEELIEYIDYINCDTDDIKEFCSLNLEAKSSKKTTYFNKDYIEMLRQEWHTQAHYYQPANRYEEPFWKNPNFDGSFKETKKYINKYDKELEIITSLEKNYSYILNIVLDALTGDEKATNLCNTIDIILQEIKQDRTLEFRISHRNFGSRIGIYKDEKLFLNNINQLSLGELTLLNLFVNIIRHTDLSNETMDKFEGIVVIDEIDVHLHSDLQSKVLPSLIKLFPKIQFIITTHSPLFVLGMQKEFEDDRFDLLEMPNGIRISAEIFSEFQKAYDTFRQTKTFEENIKKSKLPLVLVEGDYDIRYIKHVCTLFQREDILNNITLYDADGYENLNKIWRSKETTKYFDNKILLLYDCDTKIENKDDGNIFKRIIPPQKDALFDRGIENLFSKETINKIRNIKCEYIDFTPSHETEVRGKKENIPDKYSVNKDEKRNLCNWICENGTEEDFENFKVILEIIDEFLEKKD
ncbi:AAA domain protein [Campylobacter lari]|uniref:ATP-binding protein n=1 Tax=Campylobacter lari TaxID=201 RepID=UPI00057F48F8|nr:AAA domain protein [Campylobacter lari]AJC89903.1 ATPase, AAA family [Campylobacter lari subsp. concheus LMG 11760]